MSSTSTAPLNRTPLADVSRVLADPLADSTLTDVEMSFRLMFVSAVRGRVGYFGPADSEPIELVRVAGTRWAIEELFQITKSETRLDHYQVLGYPAKYRHITLSMAAAAVLTILRLSAQMGISDRCMRGNPFDNQRDPPIVRLPLQSGHRISYGNWQRRRRDQSLFKIDWGEVPPKAE